MTRGVSGSPSGIYKGALILMPSIEVNFFHPCAPLAAAECQAGEFACYDNRTCIPLYWECDGFAQCSDSSDEDDSLCRESNCHWCTVVAILCM